MRSASARTSRSPGRGAAASCAAALFLIGCAETHVSGREILRLTPLRDTGAVPAHVDAVVVIDAGSDALTDAELTQMQSELGAHLAKVVSDARAKHKIAPRGTARVRRCVLRAGAGRRNTTYVATCRVAVVIDDVAVVEAEAKAIRLTGARAVTKARAQEIRRELAQGGRHPLLSYDDARLALEASVTSAVDILVTGDVPRAEGEPAPVPVDAALMRRDALRRLQKARGTALAAAAVDLGRWGSPDDGTHLVPLLDDGEPLVRRAAATSIGELGAKAGWASLHQRKEDPDPQVVAAVELAIKRLGALYPELPEDPELPDYPELPEVSSKSSTAGGGE